MLKLGSPPGLLKVPQKRKADSILADDLEQPPRKTRRASNVTAAKTRTSTAGLEELELCELFCFSKVETLAECSARFQRIAPVLLSDHRLAISTAKGQTEYDILEIEFYLQKPGVHEDPFTHGSEEQKVGGNWYFHRAPRKSASAAVTPTVAGGYRGGTRKGLDLTLGSIVPQKSRFFQSSDDSPQISGTTHSETRGGVLLRSIRRVKDSVVISGPSLLVDEILRVSGAPNIARLVVDKWQGNSSAFRPSSSASTSLRLVPAIPAGTSRDIKIYSSPRIGLDLSNPSISPENARGHPRVLFVSQPYRFFTHPHLLVANGRGQTLFGVHRDIQHSGRFHDQDAIYRELEALTGIKTATAAKYLAEYRFGKAKGLLKNFLGAPGKGASASPMSFFKMMGVVEKLLEE